MKKGRTRIFILMGLAFVVLTAAAIRAHSYIQDASRLIEVCRNGIVYVPLRTKYVTCNGIIRRVIGFSKEMALDGDCYCPQCCGGNCYVIVECAYPDIAGELSAGGWKDSSGTEATSPDRSHCALFLDCGGQED